MDSTVGLRQYTRELLRVLDEAEVTTLAGRAMDPEEGIARGVDMLLEVAASGAKVMLVGNGGSAAVVSHVQNDIAKAVGARAMVFNEAPLLTALTNDESYEAAFARCVELWAEPGDMLIAVSSGGRSPNIIKAAGEARERSCGVVTLSGFAADNPLRTMGDLNIYVPSSGYGHVEVAHAALLHCLTDAAMTRRAAAGG